MSAASGCNDCAVRRLSTEYSGIQQCADNNHRNPEVWTMTLSLRQLRFFVAAAEAGTIAGAAAREHISQSTIALAVSELERTLGVQLFLRRQAKGLTITQAGLAVLVVGREHAARVGLPELSCDQLESGGVRHATRPRGR
jgi:DNA-binding transcriptional LysR family regulator